MTEIKDYKAIEKKMDWSYSTPYKGSVHRINDEFLNQIRIELGLTQHQFQSLDIENEQQTSSLTLI